MGNKPVCNLFPSVLRSVYVTCPWFLFHELSKARAYTCYTTSHVLPAKGRRSLGARYSLADSGSESTSESEEEIEVS